MARAPRANVPKTSGQGVSRLSYQKGYALKNRAGAPKVDIKIARSEKSRTGANRYAKVKSKPKVGINVSYGSTLDVSDLDDVKKKYPKRGK